MKKPTRRKCAWCRGWFHPVREGQIVCTYTCAAEYGRAQTEKARAKAAQLAKQRQRDQQKEERAAWRERKDKLTTKSEWMKRAQDEFNAYIRERDFDRPCISCGDINPPDLHGGKWDCGHFLSVGSHPELRFEEKNAFRQCKRCNGGAGHYTRKNHTVSQQYRENLIAEFGQDYVDWLEGPHEPKRYRIEDYQRIRDEYKAKRKFLMANREDAA